MSGRSNLRENTSRGETIMTLLDISDTAIQRFEEDLLTRVILEPPELRPNSSFKQRKSSVFVTPYNQRLPKWRWKGEAGSEGDEKWRNRYEFIAAALGFTIGLGGIAGLVEKTIKYGGAYIYIFTFLNALVGIPLVFFEVALGQFTAKGPVQVYELVPLAQGIGYSIVIYCFFESSTLIMRASRVVYYLYLSLNVRTKPLRWTLPWLTYNSSASCFVNSTHFEKYYFDQVLHRSCKPLVDSGLGEIQWPLITCLAIFWFCIFIATCRGIKTAGKIMVVCMPFVVGCLVIMLIVFSTLPGSGNGISYFMSPTLDEFLDYKVYMAALNQTIFMYGIGFGCITLIGSYSRFQSPAHIDSLIICVCTNVAVWLFGMLVFSGLGAVAYDEHRSFDVVTHRGQRQFLSVSTMMLSLLPFPPIWSVLYFAMLTSICFTCAIATTMVFSRSLYAMFPHMRKYEVLCTFLITFPQVVYGSIFLTSGGPRLNVHMKSVAPYPAKIVIACELLAFLYGYGLRRLRGDLDFMLHFNPNRYYRYTWIASPFILLAMEVVEFATVLKVPTPVWASTFGFVIFVLVLLPIPVVAIYKLVYYSRRGDLRGVLRPPNETFAFIPEGTETRRRHDLCGAFFRRRPSGPIDSYTSAAPRGCAWWPWGGKQTASEEEKDKRQLQRGKNEDGHRLGVLGEEREIATTELTSATSLDSTYNVNQFDYENPRADAENHRTDPGNPRNRDVTDQRPASPGQADGHVMTAGASPSEPPTTSRSRAPEISPRERRRRQM